MLPLGLCAAAAESSGADDPLKQGIAALRRGLNAKAWDFLKAAYRDDPEAAWVSAQMQESLCQCAVKLRKTSTAISACRNASALRGEGHTASLSVIMARGEAHLMADEPRAAWAEFKQAKAVAERGEAPKKEKEADEAMRRAEQAFYTSFRWQRGAVAAEPAQNLGTASYASPADALEACAQTPGCRAVGTKLVSSKGKPTEATLYNASEVRPDTDQKPTKRQGSFVRESPTAYRQLPGTLVPGMFARALPTGAASGVRLTVQRAMHLCDAVRQVRPACSGFIVETGGEEIAADRTYRVEFRVANAEISASDPSPVHEHSRFVSFVHVDDVQPRAEREQPKPKAEQGGAKQPPRGGEPPKPGRGRGGSQSHRPPPNQRQQPFGRGPNAGGPNPFERRGRPPPRRPPPPPPPPKKQRRDYYAILKVDKGASARQIKKAYHQMAKKWHPDKNRQPGQEARLEKAERNFKLVARAYEVLGDADIRAAYDDGVDVDDSKWQQSEHARKEQAKARQNVRFAGGANGDFRRQRR